MTATTVYTQPHLYTHAHIYTSQHSNNTYLSVEEVHEQLLHLGDARAAAHQHNLVDLTLVDLRVAQHLLHRLQRRAEQVVAKLLEASTRDRAKRGG